jgi:hypothetical protein
MMPMTRVGWRSNASRCIAACALAAIMVIACSSLARASVIDFEALLEGEVLGGTLVVVVDGIAVTFSAGSLFVVAAPDPFPATNVLVTGADAGTFGGLPLTVTFPASFVADFVEVTNVVHGAFTPEVDGITGCASIPPAVDPVCVTSGAALHHIDGPGIVKVIYDDSTAPGFSGGFTIDDFTFTGRFVEPEPSPVPGPSAFFFVVSGLTLLGLQLGRGRRA